MSSKDGKSSSKNKHRLSAYGDPEMIKKSSNKVSKHELLLKSVLDTPDLRRDQTNDDRGKYSGNDIKESRSFKTEDELNNVKRRSSSKLQKENNEDKRSNHRSEKSGDREERKRGKKEHQSDLQEKAISKQKVIVIEDNENIERYEERSKRRHRSDRIDTLEEEGHRKKKEKSHRDDSSRHKRHRNERDDDDDDDVKYRLRDKDDKEYEIESHKSHEDRKRCDKKNTQDKSKVQKSEISDHKYVKETSKTSLPMGIKKKDNETFNEYNEEDFKNVEYQDQEITSAEEKDLSSTSSTDNVVQSTPSPVIAKEMETKKASNSTKNDINKNMDSNRSTFINFKIVQKKYSHDLVANKMLSRAFDLSRLIELDRAYYDIIEMTPVSEHGQYMRLFGREGCQHEVTQTGDDNVSREMQTETIEQTETMTQHPPVDTIDDNILVESKISEPDSAITCPGTSIPSPGTLKRVVSIIEKILEEESFCELRTKINSTTKDGKSTISSGFNKYNSFQGSECILARFAPSNSNMFVTVSNLKRQKVTVPASTQSSIENESSDSDLRGLIEVWKVSARSGKPHMILDCPSVEENGKCPISCVTFSPDHATSHILCGLTSGAIALWDLGEYSMDSKQSKTKLVPAYLTANSKEDYDNEENRDGYSHNGPIISLQPIITNGTSSGSYQLISLDSFGLLFIWIVNAVSMCSPWNLESGSLSDLNLRPGSKYRLSRISSVSLGSNIEGHLGFHLTSMAMDPNRSNHLYIGTNGGKIMQHVRSTNKDKFKSSGVHHKVLGNSNLFESGAVTHLDFYPFFEPFLLAGYDDGCIKIFTVGRSQHLLSFYYKENVPILQVKWSRSHPSIFFSLNCEGTLCVWNILIDLYQPVLVQQIPGYIGFDLSSDSKWQAKKKNSNNNKARLLLWALDGRIEVHDIAEIFSNPDLDVSFKVCSVLQSLM